MRIVLGAGLVVGAWAARAEPASPIAPALAKPTAKQIRFADWEVGAFFHYDLNPFTGQEHGDGQEPPERFSPSSLDVNQWIRTAKHMGARYAVLTARHEGGFCLWPSKTTDYTIAHSPYRDGNGDLVREFVDACRRSGLRVGLYHTAGFDANRTLRDYTGPIETPLDWGSSWGCTMAAAHRADHGLLLSPGRVSKTGIAEFDLTRVPQAKDITAVIGIEDMVRTHGSCVFLVEGYRDGAWMELYRSPRIRGGEPSTEIDIVFPEGLERLRLKTTDAGDGINSDHAVWADARFRE